MRGVIVEGELYSGDGSEQVLLFVELEDGELSIRRTYGSRAQVLNIPLSELLSSVDALRAEAKRAMLAAPMAEDDPED
jgi:hypothetical protein